MGEKNWQSNNLNQISHIHGHLINLCGIVLFNVPQNPDVIWLDEVYSHTFSAETTWPADTMNVQLTVVGQVIVND